MSLVPDYSNRVEEPLAQTAAMARQWAAQNCAHNATGVSCKGYHGFWQYLRLMNLGQTLGGNADQYLRTMTDLSRDWDEQGNGTPRRILISGCADYSMLAHVLHAFARAQVQPRITVLDICPTPLKLNGWYAKSRDTSVELVCSDLLRHCCVEGYDLIVTSSFLGYFGPNIRPRLFEVYAALLSVGGRLVFSNRLRPSSEDTQAGFTSEQTERFARKVAELSPKLPASATLETADAYRMAFDYAAIQCPFPVNSADTIRRLAADAGLKWRTGSHIAGLALQRGVTGPTVGDGSDYVFAVLEK